MRDKNVKKKTHLRTYSWLLLISVGLIWGQTGTSGRAADSSAPPAFFPAPTPAALATAEHAISGHEPGPSGPSPVTDLLKLLLANVNSTEAFTNMWGLSAALALGARGPTTARTARFFSRSALPTCFRFISGLPEILAQKRYYPVPYQMQSFNC